MTTSRREYSRSSNYVPLTSSPARGGVFLFCYFLLRVSTSADNAAGRGSPRSPGAPLRGERVEVKRDDGEKRDRENENKERGNAMQSFEHVDELTARQVSTLRETRHNSTNIKDFVLVIVIYKPLVARLWQCSCN